MKCLGEAPAKFLLAAIKRPVDYRRVFNIDERGEHYREAICESHNHSCRFDLSVVVVSTEGPAQSSTNSIQSNNRGIGKRCGLPNAES
jgi:hypothetical protein